jgi:hypothetical protein
MPIVPSITGSVLRFAVTGNAGTASSTITVPADAQLVVVTCAGWIDASTTLAFSGGSLTFTKGGVDTPMTIVPGGDASAATFLGAIAYLALPDTGANKTFKWDLIGANNPQSPPLFTVTFWKDVDTASPIRSSNAIQASGLPYTSGTLTCLPGDVIFANAFASCGGVEGTADTWANLTLHSQVVCNNDSDCALGIGYPSGNTTVAASTGTNWADGGIAAIVIKGPDQPVTPIRKGVSIKRQPRRRNTWRVDHAVARLDLRQNQAHHRIGW